MPDNEDRESRDPQREHRRIEEKIDRVILLLTGNGNPERGIVVRLDRLEQQAQGRKGFADKVINAVIAALVALGFSWFAPHR